MIKAENVVIINKPVEEVFAFTNEPENTAKWQPDVVSVEYPNGKPKEGDQFKEVRKFMGKDMETTLEITALKPNVQYSAKTLTGPVPYEVSVNFESVEGGTKMTTVIEGEAGGFFKLAEGMVAKQLNKSLKEDSERLKSVLEAS